MIFIYLKFHLQSGESGTEMVLLVRFCYSQIAHVLLSAHGVIDAVGLVIGAEVVAAKCYFFKEISAVF